MGEVYFKDVFNPALKEAARVACRYANRTKLQRRSKAYADCDREAQFEAYAASPLTQGCVVKTLTGRGCSAEDAVVGPGDVARAIARLALFQFVGVFEDWTAMVYSLHETLGFARATVGPLDFVHKRTTKGKVAVPAAFRAAYADPYDQPLYEAAVELYCGTFRTRNATPFATCGNRTAHRGGT